MNITRYTCESVFLDYYEKNLSPVEVAEVLFFLEENPEMKEVFERYEAIGLEYEKVNFPDKESLKKKYSIKEIDAILSSDITRTNCEQFFIANAEGILSASQKENLKFFLLQYPELKKESELFLQCILSAENISFEGKESLKKELITEQNREEYFVRAIENDLNSSEQKALNVFLAKRTEFKKELKLFSKTILPSEEIYFENKSSLKKRERKPIFVSIFSQRTTYYAAAATILLLVGLFFFFKNDDTDKTFVADKTHPANNKTVNIKPENNNNASIKQKQIIASQTNDQIRNITHHPSNIKWLSALHPESEKEEIKLQPIIIEDNENLIAKEELQPQMIKEENVTVQKKEEEKKDDEVNTSKSVASAVTAKSNNDYQTLGSFARKKIRSALGIKNATECASSDKIDLWNLAMAAKNGIQNIIGTKAVDVNKICDGTGNKSEYVFTAGNFEISRSASK
ncbi:MAG: hypothetical protein AABZ32_00270 [Bacteroidota bacterium]